MSDSNLIVGADNGLSGAFVALSRHSGAIIAKLPMPLQSNGKGNEVNVREVWSWLSQWPVDTLTVVLETPGKHSPGVNALCSMWDSYGAIRSLLETRNVRHDRVAPVTWQKAMLPGCEKGKTKPMALAVARRLWPDENWLATPRCKKPDEGLIDAALIAENARRKGI